MHWNSPQIGHYVAPEQDGCRKQNGGQIDLDIGFGYIFWAYWPILTILAPKIIHKIFLSNYNKIFVRNKMAANLTQIPVFAIPSEPIDRFLPFLHQKIYKNGSNLTSTWKVGSQKQDGGQLDLIACFSHIFRTAEPILTVFASLNSLN